MKMKKRVLHANPKHVYLETSLTECNGTSSQVSVYIGLQP